MAVFKRLSALALLAAIFGAPIADAFISSAMAQDGEILTHSFKDDNVRRMLYTPKNASQLSGTRPLVLVIHGGGSTDRGMIKLTKSRWHELADQYEFYVAYPNAAFKKTWGFGEGKISNELRRRVDDLAYFKRVVDDASARAKIDQSRVFATGISRGGQASYFLACNAPDLVRAVMPVAMGLPKFMLNECRGAPPVAIAIMNGTADPQVPYGGGEITVFRKKRGAVRSADESLALWLDRNGCDLSKSTSVSIDEDGDKTSVEVTSWSQCTEAPVKFYKVLNGGHTWPSGLQYLPPLIVGHTSQDIDASDEARAFFSQF